MIVLLSMVFMHLVDDYKMQGWLADGKNKYWWQKNCPDKKYSKDYIIALVEHGFMNSFFIHIPIYLWLCKDASVLAISVLIATAFHTIVDDLKANRRLINLIQDQLLHIGYIIILWIVFSHII